MTLNWTERIPPWVVVIWSIAIQIAVVVIFATRLDLRTSHNEELISVERRDLERLALDLRLSNERVDRLETPLAKKVEAEIKRLDERTDRIVQALDALYNRLVEDEKRNRN